MRRVALVLVLALAACGGGGSPAGPSPPSPSPGGFSVRAVVFYDENGNGRLDGDEVARVPDVEVRLGGRSARSEKGTGRVVVEGVPAGTHALTVATESVPPFYSLGQISTVDVPQAEGAQALIPLTLPIRGTRPNVYMAFGDSITRGELGLNNYPAKLQDRLRPHFNSADVSNRGADATNSYEAMERIKRNLGGGQPAFTLVLYGTNDWHDQTCQGSPPCRVAENLRTVIRDVKAFGSLPFVSTILPVNPALNPGRNEWIAAVNETIRPMAREEGAFLVDANAFFRRQGDMSRLFVDEVHPNGAGYEVLAEAFFEAIAHGRSVPAAGSSARSYPGLFTQPTLEVP